MPRNSKRNDRKPRYGGPKSVKKSRAKPRTAKPSTPESEHAVRLQKILAAAGVGSRRECEEIIREGRITVDGETVTEMGTRVDPDRQQIRVDGEALRRPKRHYYVVNKPSGILSTSKDPSGRPRVIDLTPNTERLFTVGRLDKTSEGLILVTNDGKLTDMLTHPRYGVEKTYLAQVAGIPSPESLAKLRRGVKLAEGFAHAKRVFVRRSHGKSSILEMVLDEGRNREVRRLLARVGHKVMKLRRTAMGPLRIGELKPGESRTLRREEVEELYRAAQEGKRDKARERHERHKSQKASEKFVPPESTKVRPIIDKSIPASEFVEDELPIFADGADNLGELVTEHLVDRPAKKLSDDDDLEGFGSDDTELDLAGEDFGDDDEEGGPSPGFKPIRDDGAEEYAAIDLSPIAPSKNRGPRPASVIGSDPKPKSRGNRNFGKSQGKKRQPRGGKPRGGAGGRGRGRG
jgi:23S rRNA pseudouridine2605 synthase